MDKELEEAASKICLLNELFLICWIRALLTIFKRDFNIPEEKLLEEFNKEVKELIGDLIKSKHDKEVYERFKNLKIQ